MVSRTPTTRKIRRFREELFRWAAVHGRDYPWRHTRDVYRLLVAELMLRRTRSAQVVPIYSRFVETFPTLETLASAPRRTVKRALYSLGLEHRAEQMAAFAAEARAKYGGTLPSTPGELQRIQGVGDYVSKAVACFSSNAPLPFVDVNVARVLGRVFGLEKAVNWRYADVRTRKALVNIASRCVPSKQPGAYHYALLDFGALICRPTPSCPDCPMHRARICSHCRAKRKSLQLGGRRSRKTNTQPA